MNSSLALGTKTAGWQVTSKNLAKKTLQGLVQPLSEEEKIIPT